MIHLMPHTDILNGNSTIVITIAVIILILVVGTILVSGSIRSKEYKPKKELKVDVQVKFGGGISSLESMALIPGQTLLFRRELGENVFAAVVEVVQILYDKDVCKVKVSQIVKQGINNELVPGELLNAEFSELTAV